MRDCWRRCLARVVGIEWQLVPDPVGENPQDWLAATVEWLATNGWAMVAMVPFLPMTDLDYCVDALQLAEPKKLHIAVGYTSHGFLHAVVKEGSYVWDPQGELGGVTTVVAMYWVVRSPDNNGS